MKSIDTNQVVRLACIAAVLSLLAGCQRSESPAPAPDAASAEAPAATPPPAPAPAASEDAVPEGALRAYVWECQDGQKIVMHNLFRDRAVELDFIDGSRRLEQTVSASGVRYADDSMVFWTKGSTASLERQGAGPVQCEERRSESLLEDARARGVIYRARGNEPGWVLDVGPAGKLDWTTNYGQERHIFPQSTESSGTAPSEAVYAAQNGADAIKVTVRQQPCTDDGDLTYAYAATVEFGGALYRGCAVRLDDKK